MASLQTILELRTITKKKKKQTPCRLILTSLTPQYIAYKFRVGREGEEEETETTDAEFVFFPTLETHI